MWNFFRLENEHLNNCGEFRAIRACFVLSWTSNKSFKLIIIIISHSTGEVPLPFKAKLTTTIVNAAISGVQPENSPPAATTSGGSPSALAAAQSVPVRQTSRESPGFAAAAAAAATTSASSVVSTGPETPDAAATARSFFRNRQPMQAATSNDVPLLPALQTTAFRSADRPSRMPMASTAMLQYLAPLSREGSVEKDLNDSPSSADSATGLLADDDSKAPPSSVGMLPSIAPPLSPFLPTLQPPPMKKSQKSKQKSAADDDDD